MIAACHPQSDRSVRIAVREAVVAPSATTLRCVRLTPVRSCVPIRSRRTPSLLIDGRSVITRRMIRQVKRSKSVAYSPSLEICKHRRRFIENAPAAECRFGTAMGSLEVCERSTVSRRTPHSPAVVAGPGATRRFQPPLGQQGPRRLHRRPTDVGQRNLISAAEPALST